MNLTFNDVLIKPKFSYIESRKNVSLEQDFLGIKTRLPVISSNMDTITESNMSIAMKEYGGIGALHRFMTVQQNIDEFKKCPNDTIVSVGTSIEEFDRAQELFRNGAKYFLIDVAHGAALHVVAQYNRIRDLIKYNGAIIVGNFATYDSIVQFELVSSHSKKPDAYKLGIGPGSQCSTRIVTGCGVPSISMLQDCKRINRPLIMDGGMKNSGDVAKALAAGATMCMTGYMLAGTDETPGDIIFKPARPLSTESMLLQELISKEKIRYDGGIIKYKNYRGSASKSSYIDQNKIAEHRTPEGKETLVSYKGPVKDVLQQIEAGLKSSLSYTGSYDIIDFRSNVELITISNNSYLESLPNA